MAVASATLRLMPPDLPAAPVPAAQVSQKTRRPSLPANRSREPRRRRPEAGTADVPEGSVSSAPIPAPAHGLEAESPTPGASAHAAQLRPAVVSARGLTKVYRMGEVDVHALRGVDIDLLEGELMVLLGVSGSGKSTLLNILGGLDVCTEGHIAYRGQELTALDQDDLTWYRRSSVGFVFQFYNLIPSLTARENVALVTEIAADPLDPAEALDLVGLGDRLDHFPAQLSGGEQQRVAVARAVAKRPDILLCDEPTGALDFHTGVRVLAVLARINRELGTTTAIITHNAPIAALGDRVITLTDGRITGIELHPHPARPEELTW